MKLLYEITPLVTCVKSYIQTIPTGRNCAVSGLIFRGQVSNNEADQHRHLTTFDLTRFGRWRISYWYSFQNTDKYEYFSCHLIYDVWRNKEKKRKFSFWVDIKWKLKNLCWVQLFQRLRSCRLQPLVLPGAPVPIHYCGTNTLGRPKQLVMLGVSSTKQVDS